MRKEKIGSFAATALLFTHKDQLRRSIESSTVLQHTELLKRIYNITEVLEVLFIERTSPLADQKRNILLHELSKEGKTIEHLVAELLDLMHEVVVGIQTSEIVYDGARIKDPAMLGGSLFSDKLQTVVEKITGWAELFAQEQSAEYFESFAAIVEILGDLLSNIVSVRSALLFRDCAHYIGDTPEELYDGGNVLLSNTK
jgi:hypothetical protein